MWASFPGYGTDWRLAQGMLSLRMPLSYCGL
jgi:hypothetical protein